MSANHKLQIKDGPDLLFGHFYFYEKKVLILMSNSINILRNSRPHITSSAGGGGGEAREIDRMREEREKTRLDT